MPFRDTFTSRGFVRSLRVNSGNESFIAELAKELEELRKVSSNLLMTFLTYGVHAISPPSLFGTITLALLVYTINPHITVNAGFLQHSPALSGVLHIVTLFGILCMSIFQLVVVVQSPPVAAAVLFACALPPLVIWFHFTRRYIEMFLSSPVRVPASMAVLLNDQ